MHYRADRADHASLKEWLDGQQKRRTADTAMADNPRARLNTRAALYQAPGGDAGPAGAVTAPSACCEGALKAV